MSYKLLNTLCLTKFDIFTCLAFLRESQFSIPHLLQNLINFKNFISCTDAFHVIFTKNKIRIKRSTIFQSFVFKKWEHNRPKKAKNPRDIRRRRVRGTQRKPSKSRLRLKITPLKINHPRTIRLVRVTRVHHRIRGIPNRHKIQGILNRHKLDTLNRRLTQDILNRLLLKDIPRYRRVTASLLMDRNLFFL